MQRVISPRNENFNVLVQIKFLNIFLYISKKKLKKIYWSKQSFTGLGPEDWCSSWGMASSNLHLIMNQQYKHLYKSWHTSFFFSFIFNHKILNSELIYNIVNNGCVHCGLTAPLASTFSHRHSVSTFVHPMPTSLVDQWKM